jgi:predicted aldo/keto reductase-like oxidoreductase
MDEDLRRAIDNDRKELQGEFCRGCGYCLPCPAQINIPVAARISLLLRRAPVETYTSASHREMMQRIENCTQCHHCLNHCPYKLDVPRILKDNLKDYNGFISNPQYS